MSSSIYTARSNAAYAALGVIPPGQGWFAFDVPMPAARRGEASKFAMAIWNYHSEDEAGKIVRERGIWRDRDAATYWYRVPRDKAGQHPNKRKSLWDALHLAVRANLPMHAMLKDRLTRRCAPHHVFPIGEVRQNHDGTVLWLRIDVGDRDIGTEVDTITLPPLLDLTGSSVRPRSAKLTETQYTAAAALAEAVYRERLGRTDAIQELASRQGVTEATAAVLLNDYRCLVDGDTIKAPISADAMACFVDHVLACHGDSAITNVITAVDSFIRYSDAQWGSPAAAMRGLLEDLKLAAADAQRLQPIIAAAAKGLASSEEAQPSDAESEILREIWVRGPQHAAFKRMLLRRWGRACSVHGVECNGQLRASHIVAWRLDKTLRGDVNNGLLLSVPLDSLFDRGLISFSDDGFLVRSHKLDASTGVHFGLRAGLRLKWSHLSAGAIRAICANLERHRQYHAHLQPYLSEF